MYFKVCRLYTYLYVYLRVRFSEKEEWKIKTKVALCLMFVITLSSSFYDGQGLKLSFIHRNVLKKHERDSRLVQKLRKIKIIHYSNTCYYKAVPFLINSEFNTGCDGLYSYSFFIFFIRRLKLWIFFLQLGLKIWLEFSISVLFTFELPVLDLHAKQGSGLISNFIQFFFETPTYIILGCNCIIQVKGIWSVALEMSYWKIIVSVF